MGLGIVARSGNPGNPATRAALAALLFAYADLLFLIFPASASTSDSESFPQFLKQQKPTSRLGRVEIVFL